MAPSLVKCGEAIKLTPVEIRLVNYIFIFP